MTVNLTPEVESFVAAEVAAGRFASAEELLTAAVLRLRDDAAADDELDDADRAAIAEAEAEVAAGLDRPWDEVEAELRRKYLGA